jgi:hypothetical protein
MVIVVPMATMVPIFLPTVWAAERSELATQDAGCAATYPSDSTRDHVGRHQLIVYYQRLLARGGTLTAYDGWPAGVSNTGNDAFAGGLFDGQSVWLDCLSNTELMW